MKKVIVIGGGIGGLCAAIALQKKGVEAHVYEKVPQIKGLGAGITLSINAILALRQAGMEEPLLAVGQELKSMQILDERGRLIAKTELGPVVQKYGAKNISLHRAALHEVLIANMQPGTLHPAKSFAHLEQDKDSAQVTFTDGTTINGDAVLAFDGIHSAVRQQLLPGAKLRYSGYTCWRGVIDYVPETGRHLTTESWGKGKRFGIVPLADNKLYWFATANAKEQDTVMQNMGSTTLNQYFAEFHHPVSEVLSLTTDEQVIWNDIIDLKPIGKYTFGRVALAGDAAHATTPNMGQGAGMAIEDAVVLAKLLTTMDVENALKLYQETRMKRTQGIVKSSYSLGWIAQRENGLVRSLRNAAFRKIPVSVQEKQMQQLYEVVL
jgi:2-polyprenyl-6-methoxyphenol hydroxylase-like FAD-dependent oxidoreductase